MIDKECKDLQADVVRMAGHQNGKQKIHYLQKVKQDNLALKQDNARLEKELARIKQQLAKVCGGEVACRSLLSGLNSPPSWTSLVKTKMISFPHRNHNSYP